MIARIVVAADVVATAGQCVAAALPAGDPARLRVAARRSAALSDVLDRSSAMLRHAAGSPLWDGEAHRAFVEAMSHGAPRLDATADRYRAYTGALQGYAVDLDRARALLPWLSREIAWRREELVRLRMTLDPLHPDAALRRRIDAAEADLWPLVRRFVEAHSSWADAVDRCSAALLRANAVDPTHDLHGWRAFGHEVAAVARRVSPVLDLALDPSLKHLSETFEKLAGQLSALGLVLSFVCPPAAAACFTVATVLAAAKLATDAVRAGNGEHISRGTFVVDAVQAVGVPGAGKVIGKVAGRFLARGEETIESAAASPIRDLPDGLMDTRGIEGDGFVLGGPSAQTRRLRWRNGTSNPKWGLTKAHLKKHLFNGGKYSLRTVDPGGNPSIWCGHLQELAARPATVIGENGVHDIFGHFPRVDGNGTYRLGIRVFPQDEDTWELVTILTRQD